MNRNFLFIIILLVHFCGCSSKDGRTFTLQLINDTILPYTPVMNQGRTQTCWAYAMTSLIESDWLTDNNKDTVQLSVMYTVRNKYMKQFEHYYRISGKEEIRGGGLGHSLLDVWKEKGTVPLVCYAGKKSDTNYHDHRDLLKKIRRLARKAVKENNYSYYFQKAEELLDEVLGEVPDTFDYQGIVYTPQSFAAAICPNVDDYMEVTSFTHHPFHSWFALEVPDNWEHAAFYNLPISELEASVRKSIYDGRTVVWDGDISEKSFYPKEGVAVFEQLTDWQLERQKAYENLETTDDHMMHIVGMAHDEQGKVYYLMKNSWGKRGPYHGLLYMSEDYFRAKTISVILRKEFIQMR